jgi:2-hydroxy-3-keto-5-methylthiopentenyl-1-phosphate phosphatase
MWGSLNMPFDDGFEVMKDALEIDTDFGIFHEFCLDNDIPFNAISAGLRPVLRKVLDHFLGRRGRVTISILLRTMLLSVRMEEGVGHWSGCTTRNWDTTRS